MDKTKTLPWDRPPISEVPSFVSFVSFQTFNYLLMKYDSVGIIWVYK